jgi:hypothetical protein
MTQLIASVALMYAVVGSAGYWAVRRQRHIAQNSSPNQTVPLTEPTP